MTAGGGGDLVRAVGAELVVPAGQVAEVMVPGALQNEVREVGRAAALPWLYVVGLAPVGEAVAAREATVAVPEEQRVPEPTGDHPGAPAEVEDDAWPVGHHPVDVGVAQELRRGRAIEIGSVEQASVATTLEVGQIEEHVHLRPVPFPLG